MIEKRSRKIFIKDKVGRIKKKRKKKIEKERRKLERKKVKILECWIKEGKMWGRFDICLIENEGKSEKSEI